MKLIVGLGNPGNEYKNTRHNAGFMIVSALAEGLAWNNDKGFKAEIADKGNWGDRGDKILLMRPQTFMNSSGEAVAAVAAFYKVNISDILVIHDDLDVKLGEFKLQQGIGPKVHNGLLSIEEKLGTKDFWRLRVGVDARDNGQRDVPGEKYVLSDFTLEELSLLQKNTPQFLEKIEGWLQTNHPNSSAAASYPF
ncbi:MAG: aminoacyl-tRNA hydrolase [candidate division WWE3 bacterium]|nr:aminoacyl-tRNA hydrolase [candidate division WWE3 bacterium]